MPRPPRSFAEGIYHVGAHGSDDRHLFVNDDDRNDFLDRLTAIWTRFELDLMSYVLLSNHYHTLLLIPDGRISRALQLLHTEYSRHHNRRHGRKAHLFRAHPFAREIVSDDDLVTACRYLARNPVEANLASDPLEWLWSSARAHAGLEPPRIPLDETSLRAAFGDNPGWRERFRAHIQAADAEDPPKRPSQ
jgi:REP element-mobilizing transposase RayT